MNTRKTIKLYNYIFIIFLLLFSTVLFNNKTIEKETKVFKNNVKALDQEGQTYRLVTSADNVQVPVPKGYVASNVTGENYVTPEYQHTYIPHKGNYTQISWSSPAGETYPWTQDENGIWISGNQGIPESTSTLESEEFEYIKGTTLTINYTYSCASSDFLYIYLKNTTNNTTQNVVEHKSGNASNPSFDYTTSTYTYTMNDWATGRYKITALFRKDKSGDAGQDSCYIKPSTYFKEDENGTETVEEDIKTRIHDGGFVIYQLTDAEIETDPNGTSININDTNKDEAQSERNQYVWVPVANVEDLFRTKTINNGILQFGQVYIFSNTSIIKETNTRTDYYKEPRISEGSDRTKYHLQNFSNINNRESYLIEQQDNFKKMIKSIEKYGGYYIGRYETGDEISHDSSIVCFKKPKIVRYNRNIGSVTWYDSYKDLQRLSGKTEKYVETGIIYGNLWDYTLKWLNETDTRSFEEIKKDCGTWGNYKNNKKTIQSGGTSPASTGGIETIAYKGEIYSDSPTASNNIFDLAGNIWEWTRSCNHSFTREQRGGYYTYDSDMYQASYTNVKNPFEKDTTLGVRGQLYIK